MKKLIIIAALAVCVTACTKQDVKPVSSSVKNSTTMSGGGDKRPSGTMD